MEEEIEVRGEGERGGRGGGVTGTEEKKPVAKGGRGERLDRARGEMAGGGREEGGGVEADKAEEERTGEAEEAEEEGREGTGTEEGEEEEEEESGGAREGERTERRGEGEERFDLARGEIGGRGAVNGGVGVGGGGVETGTEEIGAGGAAAERRGEGGERITNRSGRVPLAPWTDSAGPRFRAPSNPLRTPGAPGPRRACPLPKF